MENVKGAIHRIQAGLKTSSAQDQHRQKLIRWQRHIERQEQPQQWFYAVGLHDLKYSSQWLFICVIVVVEIRVF